MRTRRGFTILEVMVMGAIGLALISIAWWIFSSLTKQSKKLDTRLRALQAQQLVVERLAQDVRQYVHRDDWSMVDAVPPRLSLNVYRDYVLDPNSRVQRSIAVDVVNWTFSPETHYLSRNNEVMRFAQFETILFSVKTTPPGTRDYQNSIKVDGTYVPEELLANPAAVTDKDRVKWSATLGLPAETVREAYGIWLPNPFDAPNF